MSNEIQDYKKQCEKQNIKPNEEVLIALNAAGETGELNLSRKTLSAWTWEVLGRIVSSSMKIKRVNLSDCLIPPRGLTAVLTSLRHDCSVDTLILRGNAIQTTNVAYLGTLLKHNGIIKRLSLEWNSIGIFIDAFSQFCEGLGTNKSLELLDLKNNQLPPESGQYLGEAIKKNTYLKTLDLRWNNLGWKGGQYLQEAMEINQTLTVIKLTGNCMSDDMIKSIEQCAQHNGSKEKIIKDCELKTDFLKRHLKRIEEERTSEVQELSRSNEMKIRQVVRESETRVSQLERLLTERASTIDMLQERLTSMETSSKQHEEKRFDLKNQLLEKDKLNEQLVEEINKQKNEWLEKLEKKNEEIQAIKSEYENKMETQFQQLKQMEIKISSQSKEMEILAADALQLKETLNGVRKKHEEALAEEQRVHKEMVTQTEKRCEEKLSQHEVELALVRTKSQNQLKLLEQEKEELERSLSDLRIQLNRERAQWQEDLAVALQQSKTREVSKLSQYEERITSLREEKASLEKQLALSHSTMSQLQQQNSSLVAELGEPQRRLSQLHEELSTEKVASQRIRVELSECRSKLEAKRQEAEKIQTRMEDLQRKMDELTTTQANREKEHVKEFDRLQNLLIQREREIQNIRADEVERAGVLYSAFNKYLGSLSPSVGVSQASLRV
ncbi:hypothetical protein L9F63_008190 [Diploptera punctata]|uniref:Leucine-rich repeat-containing protein 45 n=1 Tax=Diploptera punctata TaxID=6984 RepID=A0AAD7Z727_DIPPU|nr:hypothetical protein L9F63_008190 [Diploptera punctata]